MKPFFSLTETLPKTEHVYQIYTNEVDSMVASKAQLEHAINVVDAQFYYTNPLMFIIMEDSSELNLDNCGHLWGDYYLLNIFDIEEYTPKTQIAAVNQTFMQQISDITAFFESDLDIEALYLDHGFYVVAIVNKENEIGVNNDPD